MKQINRVVQHILTVLILVFPASLHAAVSQNPLFLTQSAAPRVLFAMSNDHQQFVKAYTDYTDLDGDGVLDITYLDTFDYYGYFDSAKCYEYDDGSDKRFEPDGAASGTNGHECSGNNQWSGNWLNWATMTRMDIVRKVLYGGKRYLDIVSGTGVDPKSETVLERAFLPDDVHSFAKVYDAGNSGNMGKFTPFNTQSVITVCNLTSHDTGIVTGLLPTSSYPPLMQVAKGSYAQWAQAEAIQCGFRPGSPPDVVNVIDESNHGMRPYESERLRAPDRQVRVQVCVADSEEPNCKAYGSSLKPTGILQQYGEDSAALKMNFGLITGSYSENISGGVLRKNITPFIGNGNTYDNEIDTGTGIIKYLDSRLTQAEKDDYAGGIIPTLDAFRIHGRKKIHHQWWTEHTYQCNEDWPVSCADWGNPLSEIYLEGLRYLSGKEEPTSAFDTDDSSYITGLKKPPSWIDPLPAAEWCADLSVITLSTGLNSYDTDDLYSDIDDLDIGAMTNEVGDLEGMNGNDYYIGENLADNNAQCTAKTINNLADVKGLCPEMPRQKGGFHIAGMAYYANTHDIRPKITPDDGEENQTVTTYAIALAETVPRIEIPVAGKKVTILPYCTKSWGPCSMTDLTVLSLNAEGTRGEIDISWEDRSQGADYDMDAIAHIAFCAEDACDVNPGAGKVRVSTEIRQVTTSVGLKLGYFIEGTTDDRRHLLLIRNGDEGRQDFSYVTSSSEAYPEPYIYPANDSNNTAYEEANVLKHTQIFTSGNSVGEFLENPLWYTAKYGAFKDKDGDGTPIESADNSEWDEDNDGVPDGFFNARDPSELFVSLSNVLEDIVSRDSSSSSVATNSTRLDTSSKVYQARFSSGSWSGDLWAYTLDPITGALATPNDRLWQAADLIPSVVNRKIYTSTGTVSTGVVFEHTNLSATQKLQITEAEVDYIRGDQSLEGTTFRSRSSLLGDIINSDPLYVSQDNFNYYPLELNSDDQSTYDEYLTGTAAPDKGSRPDMIYVGANDGMLHALRGYGDTSDSCNPDSQDCEGQELFAYIPKAVFNKPYAANTGLADLTSLSYSHQYFVDGSPRHGDAYIDFDGTDGEGPRWGTALIGTLAAGGKGIFALDISAPDSFNADDVLWDLDESDLGSNTHGNYLGYTFSQPTIVKLATGQWGVIMGNGYYSDSREAVLLIVNLETGLPIRQIQTGVIGSIDAPNGLSTPIVIDTNGDKVADTVYAGDLQGNLWKFDISDSDDADNWSIATQDSNGFKLPLFTACSGNACTSENRQPITSKPQAVRTPAGGAVVLFGTGKYFESEDNTDASQVQSYYGILDDGQNAVSDRDALVEQTITWEKSVEEAQAAAPAGTTTNQAFDVRVTSDNEVDFSAKAGWYMDFDSSNYPGERIVANSLVRNGRIIFPTLIPDTAACSYGGDSWLR